MSRSNHTVSFSSFCLWLRGKVLEAFHVGPPVPRSYCASNPKMQSALYVLDSEAGSVPRTFDDFAEDARRHLAH